MTRNEDAVSQIVDMGFNESQARAALQASGGNIEEALNKIFQGDDAAKVDEKVHIASECPTVDSLNFTESIEMPDYEAQQIMAQFEEQQQPIAHDVPPGYYNHGAYAPQHVENAPPVEYVQEYERVGQEELHDLLDDDLPDVQFTSMYDNIHRYKRRDDEPSVLMPLRSGILESYLSPVLTIFHQISCLRQRVYQYDFDTLGFHPRWFKGEPVTIPPGTAEVKQNNEIHDLRFLMEVQRLFAILDDETQRAFTSVKSFLKAFPKDALQKFQDIETLSEAYTVLVDTLVQQLRQVGVASPKSLFYSTAADLGSDGIREVPSFNIEADDIQRNLYRTMRTLLYADDSESLDHYTLDVADVLTITFEAPQSYYVASPLEIDEKFYPQIYGKEFKPILDAMSQKNDELEKEKRTIASELLKLRVHSGKSVSSILKHSIEFLKDQVDVDVDGTDFTLKEALQDLQTIEGSVDKRRNLLIERQSEIAELKKKLSLNNYEEIIRQSPVELEPYLLTGVVFGPSQYAYLRKTKSLVDDHFTCEWTTFSSSENSDNFTTGTVDFPDLKEFIFTVTSQTLNNPVVLIYVKSSTFMEDISVAVPKSVQEFIERDNQELEKSMELILSSDSEGSESDTMDFNQSDKDSDGDQNLIHIDQTDG